MISKNCETRRHHATLFIRRKILWGVCKYLWKISLRVDERHHHPHHIQSAKKLFSSLLFPLKWQQQLCEQHNIINFLWSKKVCVKKLISLCSKLKDNIIKGSRNFIMLAVNFMSHINSKNQTVQICSISMLFVTWLVRHNFKPNVLEKISTFFFILCSHTL